MKLLVNGSCSDGNNYVLTADNGDQLLLDLGISVKDIKKSLDFNISNIVGAIISHEHLDHSKSVKDFEKMGKKTMLRQIISKYGVMSVEMQTAYQADMAVVREDGSYDYVDGADVETVVATEIEENSLQEEFIDMEEE